MGEFIQRGDVSGPPAIAFQKAYEYDADGNLIYEGWVRAGRTFTDPVWAIKKYVYDGGKLVAELWADGNPNEDNAWSGRTSLTYL